ncbi:MAG: phasin family protein [Actinomycetota bacterium]
MEPKDIPYLVLGAMSTAKSESRKMVEELIDKGEKRFKADPREAARKGEAYISELVEKGRIEQEEFAKAVAGEVQRVLGNMGVVTKADLEKLNGRIAKLEKEL